MYRITKQFTFSASHQLGGLPSGHQCARLHGHNYTVEAVLECEVLHGPGFVTDYGDLAPIGDYLDRVFDHRHLNDVMGEINPTAENLAEWLFDMFSDEYDHLVAVRVSETPRTWAEYRL